MGEELIDEGPATGDGFAIIVNEETSGGEAHRRRQK